MKILIVDDEADLTQTLAQFLGRFGHDCLTALGLREAIDSFAENRPDLVITDLQLGDGDGLDLLRHIRRSTPPTPVILMTAYHAAGAEEAARRAGAAAYLRKPFALVALTMAIDAVLRIRIP